LNASINSSDPSEDPTLLQYMDEVEGLSEDEQDDLFMKYSDALLRYITDTVQGRVLEIQDQPALIGAEYTQRKPTYAALLMFQSAGVDMDMKDFGQAIMQRLFEYSGVRVKDMTVLQPYTSYMITKYGLDGITIVVSVPFKSINESVADKMVSVLHSDPHSIFNGSRVTRCGELNLVWAATFRNATSITIPTQPVNTDTTIAELIVEDLSLNEIDPVRFSNTMQLGLARIAGIPPEDIEINITSSTRGEVPMIEVDIIAVFHWWRQEVSGSMEAFSEHLRFHIQSLLSQTELRSKNIIDQWVQSFKGETYSMKSFVEFELLSYQGLTIDAAAMSTFNSTVRNIISRVSNTHINDTVILAILRNNRTGAVQVKFELVDTSTQYHTWVRSEDLSQAHMLDQFAAKWDFNASMFFQGDDVPTYLRKARSYWTTTGQGKEVPEPPNEYGFPGFTVHLVGSNWNFTEQDEVRMRNYVKDLALWRTSQSLVVSEDDLEMDVDLVTEDLGSCQSVFSMTLTASFTVFPICPLETAVQFANYSRTQPSFFAGADWRFVEAAAGIKQDLNTPSQRLSSLWVQSRTACVTNAQTTHKHKFFPWWWWILPILVLVLMLTICAFCYCKPKGCFPEKKLQWDILTSVAGLEDVHKFDPYAQESSSGLESLARRASIASSAGKSILPFQESFAGVQKSWQDTIQPGAELSPSQGVVVDAPVLFTTDFPHSSHSPLGAAAQSHPADYEHGMPVNKAMRNGSIKEYLLNRSQTGEMDGQIVSLRQSEMMSRYQVGEVCSDTSLSSTDSTNAHANFEHTDSFNCCIDDCSTDRMQQTWGETDKRTSPEIHTQNITSEEDEINELRSLDAKTEAKMPTRKNKPHGNVRMHTDVTVYSTFDGYQYDPELATAVETALVTSQGAVIVQYSNIRVPQEHQIVPKSTAATFPGGKQQMVPGNTEPVSRFEPETFGTSRIQQGTGLLHTPDIKVCGDLSHEQNVHIPKISLYSEMIPDEGITSESMASCDVPESLSQVKRAALPWEVGNSQVFLKNEMGGVSPRSNSGERRPPQPLTESGLPPIRIQL